MSIKKVPLRQCIGCGEIKTKKGMTRVLKTSEGGIALDATGRKGGRGAYVCPTTECLKKVIKSKGLEYSFRMAIPGGVHEALEKEIEQLRG